MASRQDRLHSHRFGIARAVVALATHDADPVPSPFRRAAGAALAGAVVTVLALAAAAVYGVMVPSSGDGWRSGGSVIVERESGARYVYLDGVLHPVPNYASALLILGSGAQPPVQVPRASLARVARGATLGIAGAPDSVAPARDLLAGAWAVCSSGTADPTSTLYIGQSPPAGVPGTDGLLVAAPDGRPYLVWHGARYLLTELARSALAWSSEPTYPVAAALINVLRAGPDLAPPPVPGRGGRAMLPGTRVGDVAVETTQAGNRQYALILPDGLAPIPPLTADLLLAMPGAAPRPISQADYLLAPKRTVPAPASAVPVPAATPLLTHPNRPDGSLCATSSGAVTVDVPAVGAGTGADHIVVPPGRAALVEAESAPGRSSGVVCLVTDLGRRYAVPSGEVLGMLGYEGVVPTRVPASLVSLVPAGPALDPVLARTPLDG